MPLFLCWEPDEGRTIDDAQEIDAFDMQDAASTYAQKDWFDEAWSDHRCKRGIVVAVVSAPDDHDAPLPPGETATRFDVQVDFDPIFYAWEETESRDRIGGGS